MTDAPTGAERRPLDAAGLARVLPGWARGEVLDEVASANAVVATRAREGAEEGLVVAAEHQTAGRGRLGRVWESPRFAGLTFSVLLRPPVPDRRWPWLPLLTGVAVVEGISSAGGPACTLKWPNDVLHDGLKLAGILAERVETPRGPVAVVGVGLNVSQTPGELPVPTATSLAAAGFVVDRAVLLGSVMVALHKAYTRWVSAGSDAALADRYRSLCDTLARKVRVELPGGRFEGVAVEVDDDGGLVVASAGGRRTTVTAGDVVHLRPYPAAPSRPS